MRTSAQYNDDARVMRALRRNAKVSGAAELYGKAWSQQYTASVHAYLVSRARAGAEMNRMLASRSIDRRTSTFYTEEAHRMDAQAAAHIRAAEACAEEAEAIVREGDAFVPPDAETKPNGNGDTPPPPNGTTKPANGISTQAAAAPPTASTQPSGLAPSPSTTVAPAPQAAPAVTSASAPVSTSTPSAPTTSTGPTPKTAT